MGIFECLTGLEFLERKDFRRTLIPRVVLRTRHSKEYMPKGGRKGWEGGGGTLKRWVVGK